MKKLIYCAAALATALFAGSCQQELLDTPAGENTVTYTVEVPEVMTKAIGDGTNVNSLVYEVWKTDEAGERDLVEGTTGIRLYQKTIEFPMIDGRRKVNVTLNLVKNQNYTVLFWAQNAEASAYETSNLTAVTYKNAYGPEDTKYFSNQEGYAAFYHAEFISETSPRSKTIELRRPFAQVNIATTNSTNDGDDAELYQIKMTSSKVTIKNVPTVFNVAGNVSKATAKETGEEVVNGATPATTTFVFNEAYLPNCASADDQVSTHTVAGQSYEYAAMNYIFANGTVEVTYEINTVLKAIGGSTSTTAKVVNTVYSVPVEENYRTNIVGNLLTSTTEYEVVVDADWAEEVDEPYVVEVQSVASAQELVEAIENASTEGETNIKLEGDIDLNDLFNVQLFSTKAGETAPVSLVIPAGKNVIINLNGYTLSATDQSTVSYGLITNRGNLTVVGPGNMKLSATQNRGWNAYSSVISNTVGGNLVVEGGVVIEHLGGTDMAYGIDNLTNGKGTSAVTTIKNATVKSPYRAVRQFLNGIEATNELYVEAGAIIEGTNKSVWMQDPSDKSNTGKLVVAEGAQLKGDVYLYVCAGSTDWPVEVSIAKAALVGESTVLSGNVPAGYSVVEENGVYSVSHDYATVDGVMEIYTANGLKAFAELVNGGENFAGKTVKLVNDINLNNVEWTPIGTSSNIFEGTFDGDNHTISNLVVNGGSESNKGLFGVTHNGEIKNLVVENAKVSGRLNVAVVSGQPYTSKYTNITVKGHVEVNGMAYVGGVGGKNAYADWTNITVNVDETSYVNANSVENGTAYRTYVGGVVGFNGEGGHSFKNITSNIDVKGSTIDVGGMFGIAHYGNKFENCVCTGNVEVYAASEAGDAEEIGGIAGVWHNENGTTVTFTNCSFEGSLKANITEGVDLSDNTITGAPYSADGTGKLIIDGAEAVSTAAELTKAINAGGSYFLLNNITITEKWDQRYKANATKEIAIDGNGKTIKFACEVSDGSNFSSGFRFEAPATVKNLTVDMSEATSNWRLAAISTKSAITVDNCKFIGNANAWRAIIFGESAKTFDYSVSIKNSEFSTWKYGIQDNANGQDCKSVSIDNNIFTNAKVNVSASESITFTGNTTNSEVKITSYTASATAKVNATGNTMVYNPENTIGSLSKKFTTANVQAQKEFNVFTE